MANNSKAPKVTLNSILFAQAPVLEAPEEGQTHSKEVLAKHKEGVADHVNTVANNLAQYFVDKQTDTALIIKILSATAKAIPAAVQFQKEEAERQEKEREANRIKAQEERDRLAEEARQKAEEEGKKMLKLLTENGVDLAVAQAAVAAAAGKLKAASSNTNSTYNRVTVTVGGKDYDMPEKGNMSQELKDLVSESGLDREAFITKYRKDEKSAA